MKHARIALSSAALLLVAGLAHAAWLGPLGNPVAPSRHGFPVALYADGGDGVFVAYQGADVPGGSAIRVQHVLGDGTIAPGWSAEGAVACSLVVSTPLGALRAIPDGVGGAFLVWDEGFWILNGTYYVQHLLANGSRAPGWPARGRPVRTGGILHWPASVADGAGGVLVIWAEGGGIVSMRIRADGSNATGYPAAGRVLLAPPEPNANWSGLSIAPAHGGGFWLSALLASTDSLATPWRYRIWRLTATGALDPTWGGDDGNGFPLPTPSSALASGATSVLDDGANGAFVLVAMGSRQAVAHVLSDPSVDAAWPAPLLDLGSNDDGPVAGPGTLALDGAGGLYALWPGQALSTRPPNGWLRRARVDGTLDPNWPAPVQVSTNYQPLLLADAAGVFSTGARLISCPEEDCFALAAVGRWSADGSAAEGWPVTGGTTSPGEYGLPDSTYSGVADMVRDGAGGVFVAWTRPDVLPTAVPYGDPATVRVMRFAVLGPVAGVGAGPAGPLAIRGARFTREGIRCSVSGAGAVELAVFDLVGRRVTRTELEPGTREALVPGTSALPPGLYLVRARTRAADAHVKVFVVR